MSARWIIVADDFKQGRKNHAMLPYFSVVICRLTLTAELSANKSLMSMSSLPLSKASLRFCQFWFWRHPHCALTAKRRTHLNDKNNSRPFRWFALFPRNSLFFPDSLVQSERWNKLFCHCDSLFFIFISFSNEISFLGKGSRLREWCQVGKLFVN